MDETIKNKFHMWTHDEDRLLVECLVQLKTEQRFMADNGFKPGYAKALELMMQGKSPGCGIKGTPHIVSRIKTMKQAWQVVYDMVYGSNTFGFGWDAEKQCVVANHEVWEEYVRVHKKAATFRNKSLPHFQDLSYVWSKDRAMGEFCESPGGMEEDINEEQPDLPESPIRMSDVPLSFDSDVSQPLNPPLPTRAETSDNGRKRKRTNNNNDALAEVMRETVSSLDRTIVRVFESLGKHISGEVERERMDELSGPLLDELMGVDGLTLAELTTSHIKLLDSPKHMDAFQKLPTMLKLPWIRSLLQRE